MFVIYEELNKQAKEYITKELDDKIKDNKILERCYKEINILYDKSLLFIIEDLYKYKQKTKNISYYFDGSINNLLLLYILGINNVDPIKYKLPYELFDDKLIKLKILNDTGEGLIEYFNKCDNDLKIIKGSFVKEDSKIDELIDNHYLLIPSFVPPEDMLLKINSKNFILETVEDYRKYTNLYLPIKISEKYFIIEKNVSLENVLDNDFEQDLCNILKPETIADYIKIKSISRSTRLWKLNQDELVRNNRVNIKNLIANKEDIFDYLIEHFIDKDIAIEIVKCIGSKFNKENSYLWNKYVKIMKDTNCSEEFINVISKIIYIRGRGDAVSECLFVLDEKNYL